MNDKGARPSRLQGEETKLSFVINSHMRLFQDAMESDFAKISYSLEDDPLPAVGQVGKIFVKREDPDVFNEKDHGDTETKYVLLTNVKAIQFKYLDGEKDTLYSRWDTAEGLEHKGIYPAILEIKLEVYTPSALIGIGAGAHPTSDSPTLIITERYRPELNIPVGGPPPS